MKMMAQALGIEPAYVMGWDEAAEPIRKLFSPDTPAAKKLREIGKALSPSEDELVSIFRALNETGRQTLLGTARGLAANPDMKQDGASKNGTA